jgi:large subunit ribosomal protein L18
MALIAKKVRTKKRHFRARKKIAGTEQRPRLVVYKSNKHLAAQIVVDADQLVANDSSKTLCAVSTSSPNLKTKGATGSNIASAKILGEEIASIAKDKGIEKVVFDRGGNIYHGKIKALADSAREAGLEF